jgi:alpha-tubulin suppressor-like RCC1 family protein
LCCIAAACGVAHAGQPLDAQTQNAVVVGAAGNSPDRDDAAPQHTQIATLISGNTASCALYASGQPLCWGEGPMAFGASASSLVPVAVDELGRFSALAIGRDHACGVRAGGAAVRCWGDDDQLQLGGDLDDDSYFDIAAAPGGVKSVSAGDGNACLVAGDGQVYCWGSSCSGNLGDGRDCQPGAPGRAFDPHQPVPAIAGAVQVASSFNMSCVLSEDARVSCWGYDGERIYEPEQVIADAAEHAVLDDATDLCVGERHGCARRKGGTAVCWGENNSGQLGDGTSRSTTQSRYVQVPGLDDVSKIVCGGAHTCVLRQHGEVACWGDNRYGELGTGDASRDMSLVPALVFDSGDIVALYAGGYALSTFAVHRDGTVQGWGQNVHGELGDGTRGMNQPTPSLVAEWP